MKQIIYSHHFPTRKINSHLSQIGGKKFNAHIIKHQATVDIDGVNFIFDGLLLKVLNLADNRHNKKLQLLHLIGYLIENLSDVFSEYKSVGVFVSGRCDEIVFKDLNTKEKVSDLCGHQYVYTASIEDVQRLQKYVYERTGETPKTSLSETSDYLKNGFVWYRQVSNIFLADFVKKEEVSSLITAIPSGLQGNTKYGYHMFLEMLSQDIKDFKKGRWQHGDGAKVIRIMENRVLPFSEEREHSFSL